MEIFTNLLQNQTFFEGHAAGGELFLHLHKDQQSKSSKKSISGCRFTKICAGYQETEDQRVIMHENNEVCEELIRDSWKMYKNAMSVTNFS